MIDDNRLERYASGEMNAEERRALEREALDNPELFEALYADRALQSTLEEASQRSRVPRRRVWLRAGAAAAVAAAVTFIVVTNLRTPQDAPTNFRGTQNRPVGIAPTGDLSAPPSHFLWTSVPGTARYRVEIFDASSTLLSRTDAVDTTTTVSSSLFNDSAAERFYFRVTPIDHAGNPGEPGDPAWFSRGPGWK